MKTLFTILTFCLFTFILSAQNQTPNATTATAGMLTVSTTTSSAGGSYANKNCLAFWIQNSTANIVNTMMYYTNNADNSCADLSVWNGKIGGYANRNSLRNVDGISGATLSSHATRTCYWGKTVSLATVADGTYTVCLEIVDAKNIPPVNSTGHKYVTYTFEKGTANSTGTLVGSAQSSFSNVSIQWVPTNTAINNIELSTLYSIYPNPAISSVYVNGPNIKEIELLTLSGKSILKTNLQTIEINSLPKGIYLAKLTTSSGSFIKKIEKL
jgi:hypothetical protein